MSVVFARFRWIDWLSPCMHAHYISSSSVVLQTLCTMKPKPLYIVSFPLGAAWLFCAPEVFAQSDHQIIFCSRRYYSVCSELSNVTVVLWKFCVLGYLTWVFIGNEYMGFWHLYYLPSRLIFWLFFLWKFRFFGIMLPIFKSCVELANRWRACILFIYILSWSHF